MHDIPVVEIQRVLMSTLILFFLNTKPSQISSEVSKKKKKNRNRWPTMINLDSAFSEVGYFGRAY